MTATKQLLSNLLSFNKHMVSGNIIINKTTNTKTLFLTELISTELKSKVND